MRRGEELKRKTPLGRGESRFQARCCGKRSFATREAAEKALERVQALPKPGKVPERIYECANGFWHMTCQKPRSQKRARDTGPNKAVRELVRIRDGGSVASGGQDGLQIHHRRPRGAGGSRRADTNQPQNLILLSAVDHAWVEANREEAFELGWLVSQWDDPAEVPVHHYRYGVVYLNADGSVSNVPPVGGAA